MQDQSAWSYRGVFPTQPIELVHEGMRVIDADGDELGRVADLKIGDPDAQTVSPADQPPDTGLMGDIARAFGADVEPDVPEPFHSQLLRVGYIKIDGPGLADEDRYVAATQIASVSGDTVTLNARRGQILRQDSG